MSWHLEFLVILFSCNLRFPAPCQLVCCYTCYHECGDDENLRERWMRELKSINMSLDSSMLHMKIFTKDIIHAIVMTCLAFFNQQQTLFRRQSVKSGDMTKFNGGSETCSVLQYPQRLSSFRQYSHFHRTHLLGIDGILRMRWWKTVTNEYLCCYFLGAA